MRSRLYYTNKFLLLCYFSCLVFFVFSCSEVIEIDLPTQHQKMVVNCIFTPFNLPYPKPLAIYVGRSSNFLDSTGTDNIQNAIVQLWNNNELIGVVPYIDSLKCYYSVDFRPQVNESYLLRVMHLTDTVTCSDIVPAHIPIKKLEVIPIAGSNENGEVYSQVSITFDDQGGVKNFYECVITNIEGNKYKIFSNERSIATENYYPGILSIGVEYPDILPFCDNLFDGKTMDLNINYYPPRIKDPDREFIPEHIILVYLNSISESCYKYRTSLLQQLYQRESDILYGQSEPINVYSNIANGYGIFASYNEEVKTVILNEVVVSQ